uniref:Uncharacterized protein n=1 Tax=Angiostrongylus cantonensis TaxID=6313 RepID=A0A158PAK7_ANGCA
MYFRIDLTTMIFSSKCLPVASCRSSGDDFVATVGMCEAFSRRPINDLGAYIDRLVETLVVNSTGNQQHSKRVPTPSDQLLRESPPDLPLSYNQINCLENVHRLLKSQAFSDTQTKCEQEENSVSSTTASVPLTREILQAHTRRWEEQYRNTWQRRLKRISAETLHGGPIQKNLRPSSSRTLSVHWPTGKREDSHCNLTPNPPPPPGMNFQITTIPLPPQEKSTPPTSVNEQYSAFTVVHPTVGPLREIPTSIALSIQNHGSVIQTPYDLQWTYGSKPLPLKHHTEDSRLLPESA